ncbi:energy-coupling factor ABC transporter permease [Vampirovibrio sp.]|uniref:energy-coupling factor ABC transporter permease n=1 Tax=Vampirovibrio sp. TaxID=2717857 RepID=UPI00359345ED
MHIAEGMLPLPQALVYGALSSPLLIISFQKLQKLLKYGTSEEKALQNLAGALIFAITLFPLPVPMLGVTSHMCATPVLGILLGFWRVVLPTALALLIQALFFAHGGITTLGANILTLAVTGPLIAIGVFTGLKRCSLPQWISIALACFLGDLSVYLLDAVIVGQALSGQQGFYFWFSRIALGFAPAQIPLAILEGLLSAYFIAFLQKKLPAFNGLKGLTQPSNVQIKTVGTIAGLTLLLFGFSPLAFGAAFSGLDETVLEQAAIQAGVSNMAPWIDLTQGELALTVFFLGGFLAGLLTGLNWSKLQGCKKENSHAS